MSTWLGGVRNLKRDWIQDGTAGDRVLVQGGQFGTLPGSVSVGGLLLTDLAWSDGQIDCGDAGKFGYFDKFTLALVTMQVSTR